MRPTPTPYRCLNNNQNCALETLCRPHPYKENHFLVYLGNSESSESLKPRRLRFGGVTWVVLVLGLRGFGFNCRGAVDYIGFALGHAVLQGRWFRFGPRSRSTFQLRLLLFVVRGYCIVIVVVAVSESLVPRSQA